MAKERKKTGDEAPKSSSAKRKTSTKKRSSKKKAAKKRPSSRIAGHSQSASRESGRQDPAKTSPATPPKKSKNGENEECIVVGVGASAGGLDVYRRLLNVLPSNTGLAYVLVQHLDPNHESLMAELLSKYSAMPVIQVKGPTPIEPNKIYMIPPNKFIRVEENTLVLDEPVKERGMRLPIDYFFRSLAEVRKERSVCIVLSGTGTDGTQGLKEVKGAGGMTIAQSPESAEYAGMPRSACSSGLVDFSAPIEEIPELLVRYAEHPYALAGHETARLYEASPDHFRSILNLLHAHTNYDFRSYKKGTLNRRIQRRMGLLHVESLADYLALVRNDPPELHALFKDLLIGVTRFFRETDAWETLESEVLEPLIAKKRDYEPVRIWVPGCSTGEEAYSIAMLIYEQFERQKRNLQLQLFGTDLDDESINIARQGTYPASITADIDPRRFKRFFVVAGEQFRVSKRLRESCVFATQNLISDPPFSNLDLISCRNLLIYLEPEVQRKLTELFHFALAKEGHLFLGSSESVTKGKSFFEPLSKHHRIYVKKARRRGSDPSFPVVPAGQSSGAAPQSEPLVEETARVPFGTVEFARKTLLDRFAPPSVLIDGDHEIRYFHGRLRDYLQVPSGEPTRDLLSMAAEGLAGKIRGLIRQATSENKAASAVAPRVKRNEETIAVRVTVEPIETARERRLLLVSFLDEPTERSKPSRKGKGTSGKQDESPTSSSPDEEDSPSARRQLEYELQATREDLQSTIEELETSNEELKASNEEVMSMNEELQSTNEELETSREELQSLNEELSTVNSQLEEKIYELENTNNDLSNLLSSTEIATIFLDTDFRIRRFTPACTELLHIIPSDIGRPISDLSPRVNDADLLDDAQLVLEKLSPLEKEVSNGDDRSFVRRILPYRTSENKIEGVVVTFTDVSQMQAARRQVEVRERQQATVARLGARALSAKSLSKLLQFATRALAETLEVELAKVLKLTSDRSGLFLQAGVGWDDGLVGEATISAGLESQGGYTLQASSPVVVKDLRKEKRFQGPPLLTKHGVVSGMSVIIGRAKAPWGVLGVHSTEEREFTIDDVNFLQAVAHVLSESITRHRIEAERRDRELRLALVTDALPVLISYADHDLVYRFCNAGYENWFGLKRHDVIGRPLVEVLGEEAFKTIEPYAKKALQGERVSFESALPYRHGPIRHVRADYIPHVEEDGRVVGFYAMITDYSERRKAAEARDRLASIVEHSHDAVIGKDLDGTIISWNTAAQRIYGYTAQEAVGRSIEMLIPDDRKDELQSIFSAIRDGRAVEQLETKRVRKDGTLVDVLVTVSPIRNSNGEVTGASSIAHDLRGRLEAERALRESEERLRLAKEAAGLGIHDYDPQSGSISWDGQVRDLWGIGPEEEVSFELFMNGIHPDDREPTQAAINRSLDPAGDGCYYAEYRVQHRTDGKTRWVAATGQVSFEDRAPVRLVGTVQEITKRREAELQLEEWADRLEERVAERTAMAEKRAADLRALSAQITDAEQRARRQLAEILHDDLQQLLAAAKMRIPQDGEIASGDELQTVADLLDQALKRSRSLISELSPPVLHQGTLSDAFQWLGRHMGETHGLEVEVRCGPKLEQLDESCRTMLFNAVKELLFNVVKHAKTRQAVLEVAQHGDELRVEVKDDGEGFDPAVAFENRDGFGLFSIRERVDGYGGRLHVETSPGKGACFSIELPVRPRKQKAGHLRQPARRLPGPNPKRKEGSPLRILIADDHKIVREGLLRILGPEKDLTVVGQACDGQEAVELAAKLHPDVVVMDISMPGVNGIEATRQIVEEFPSTAVIGLSLHDNEDLGEAIRQAGAAVYLQKHVASTKLLEAIREVCTPPGRRKEDREN